LLPYRVNVDVDVPLFLPLSGQRRMTDLRYTAQQEKAHGFRINGQVNFESGWEFGFYLSNAVTARAIWNPRMEVRALAGVFIYVRWCMSKLSVQGQHAPSLSIAQHRQLWCRVFLVCCCGVPPYLAHALLDSSPFLHLHRCRSRTTDRPTPPPWPRC
jgi:hypothetical protein